MPETSHVAESSNGSEHVAPRQGPKRILQAGAAIVVFGVVLGALLGNRLRLSDLLLAAGMLLLSVYFTEWSAQRRWLRLAVAVGSVLCAFAAAISSFV